MEAAHFSVEVSPGLFRRSSSGVLGTKFQTPQGQALAQKPQPMHLLGSETISNSVPSSWTREMAPVGQIMAHWPQSRQTPQDEHWLAQLSRSFKSIRRGSKYSSLARL